MTTFTPVSLAWALRPKNNLGLGEHSSAFYCPCATWDGAEVEGREYGLDSTLAETFPCSDPLSSIPNPHAPTN